jgi:hypothetical protein
VDAAVARGDLIGRDAGDTAGAVVDPPLPPLNGKLLSPSSTLMSLTCRPSVSAAITAIRVRVPTPRSWVPQRTTTPPSGWISHCACVPRPPPPQRLAAHPTPRLIGPGVGSPVACRLSQPNRVAPTVKYSRHIALGACGGRLRIRIAIGSIFTRSASSSINISVMKQPCG